jgi:AcrR family transcriptional regulator
LTQEKIVAAAIRMADEQGLQAVSLRGVAKRLNVHVTSLYNHISTKEALLSELMAALMTEAKLPTDPKSWQDWVKRFALALRTLAAHHPGAFHVFHRGPASGEAAMQSLEAAVQAFRADGFSLVSTWCAIKAVNVTVLGLILDDLARHANPALAVDIEQLPPAQFPNIHELHAVAESTDTFEFVLDTLIAGIAAKWGFQT